MNSSWHFSPAQTLKKAKMAHLFTLIMDFRGGTYVSQVEADGIRDALIKVISNLKLSEVKFLGKKMQALMLEEAMREEPVLLSGLQNVFLVVLSPRGFFANIHIIPTVSLH